MSKGHGDRVSINRVGQLHNKNLVETGNAGPHEPVCEQQDDS